jgi:hypothetical protein
VFLCFLYSVSIPYPAGILTLSDQVYLVNVRKSITDHRVHAYHKYYVVYGRKPETSSEPSLSDLTITNHVAATLAAVESASDAHPDPITVPPRLPSPKLETSLDLSSDSQNHDRASQGPVEESSKAASDAINVPPRSPSPKVEKSSDLSSESQNHQRESQGPVESSSKAASDATEVSPDSLPLTESLPQEAN